MSTRLGSSDHIHSFGSSTHITTFFNCTLPCKKQSHTRYYYKTSFSASLLAASFQINNITTPSQCLLAQTATLLPALFAVSRLSSRLLTLTFPMLLCRLFQRTPTAAGLSADHQLAAASASLSHQSHHTQLATSAFAAAPAN